MYYGQWEGVHRMPIGGPRLKKVGNRCIKVMEQHFIIEIHIPNPQIGIRVAFNVVLSSTIVGESAKN